MSWPKLAFRVKDPTLFKVADGRPRICASIFSWDGEIAKVTTYDAGGYTTNEVHHEVLREDILWVNTEAAQKFKFAEAGVKVLGVGYGAAEKLEAFEALHPK
jgi:hypothetical protein